jgi:hypothetical protein
MKAPAQDHPGERGLPMEVALREGRIQRYENQARLFLVSGEAEADLERLSVSVCAGLRL